MRISKLTIKGFRSYNVTGADLLINENFSAFIGLNSSGKSSALEALRKVFGSSFPERELLREDFHVSLNEDSLNAKYLSIEVGVTFDIADEDAIAQYFSHMVVNEEGSPPYLRIRLEGNWEKSDILENGNIEQKLYFIKVGYEDAEQEDSKIPCPNHLKSLIQIIYIPAVRNPIDQVKYSAGSIFYRVLKKIKWNDDFKNEFEDKISEINTLFDGIPEFTAISTSINTFWKQFHKDKRYEDASLSFGSSDYESILKKLEISFDPSGIHRPYKIKDLGDGYRSLFYITLVCALLDIEEKLGQRDNEIIGTSAPLLTILALEEPENHIAPQLLGRVINNLIKIADKKNSQVVISSHTPSIIKRIKPEAIFHFRIDTTDFRTVVNNIVLPNIEKDAYKFIKEAVYNYPEIYFAKLVVIGEGDSEEILFNKLASIYNTNFDDNIISFAPLGHRFVSHIWRLLKGLNIPYVTLLDLDIGREGGGFGRIKYAIKELIKIGKKKEDLLAITDGILSDERLEKMHEWKTESADEYKTIKGWCKSLEKYNVYYSKPLDLDFLLLEHFNQQYLSTIPSNGGPRIPDKTEEPEEFEEKVKTAVKATLKSETSLGEFYSAEQKEQMIYYNYLFLGRGKPSTHIQALSKMTDVEMDDNMPEVFEAIFKRILKKLEISNEED
nr:AAA family ATPase [Pedobacter panaciterrae]